MPRPYFWWLNRHNCMKIWKEKGWMLKVKSLYQKEQSQFLSFLWVMIRLLYWLIWRSFTQVIQQEHRLQREFIITFWVELEGWLRMYLRFRVLLKPIALNPVKVEAVVFTCVYLYNFLQKNSLSRSYTPHRTYDSYDDNGNLIPGS